MRLDTEQAYQTRFDESLIRVFDLMMERRTVGSRELYEAVNEMWVYCSPCISSEQRRSELNRLASRHQL